MVLRRVGIFSAGKVCALLGVVGGLLAGAIFALVSVLGGGIQPPPGANAPPLPVAFFGIGALIFLPLVYGIMGFISGIIYAALYNLAAGIIGGLELEFEAQGPQY